MRYTVRGVVLTVGAFLLSACAPNPPSGPVRRGEETVTAWLTDQGGSTPGKIIYMRNNSDAPITITSLTLYECENIRNTCIMMPLSVRLDPGQAREIQRVEPQRREQSFRFRFRFGWGPAQ